MPAPLPAPILPPLSRSTVLACSFSSWHPRFRSCCPKATVLPLSDDFIAFLRQDGLFLPDGCEDESEVPKSQLSDSDDSGAEGYDAESRTKHAFPELTAQIRRVIAAYRGAVFPKLNWSAPQDAGFLLPSGDGTLRCQSPADVFLLLKGSDFVAHDLERAFDGCSDAVAGSVEEGIGTLTMKEGMQFELVIKKWYHLHPAGEFRCFVRYGRLLGVSTRSTIFYAFLTPSDVRSSILTRITDFFTSTVTPRFTEPHYTFDLYLPSPTTTASPFPRPTLIDFNPFAHPTSPLLFSWEDLRLLHVNLQDGALPELRLFENEAEASQSVGTGGKFGATRVPGEVAALLQGADLEDFQRRWGDAMQEAMENEVDARLESNAS